MTLRRVAAALVPALLAGCAARPPVAPPPPRPVVLAAPRVIPGPLEATPLLGDLPVEAARLGAGPLAIVASGPMSEGERVGAFVEVPTDACLLAYARASASLEDVDLAAFAEEGNPLAVDEGPDPKPTLLICPPHPARVYVAVHAAAGEGLCVVAAQLVPRDRAPAVGRAANARGAAPKSPETWPGLESHVRAHRAAIGGAWEEQRRVAVAVDARAPSSVGLSIEEGGCTDAVVVPDDDVAVLDVDVLDAEGRLVARARDTSAVRTVTICSPLAEAGSLRIRPHVGRGIVAVVIAKASAGGAREMLTRPDVVWAASGHGLEAARAARERALASAGYGAPVAVHAGQLQLGRRVTIPVELPANPCARIDVVAGAPLALVEAAVWDDAGSLLAAAEGPDGAVLFACAKGRARVDLGTRGRPGPFTVLVRPEKWRHASFAAHPLAASRMLARAAGLAAAGHEGKPGAVHHAVLEPSKRYLHDANISEGQCLHVSAGVEGEGTGLELRMFDAVSGDELDRSHGQVSAAVRACAADAARSVRVEARATAGKLDAVLGERVVPSR